MDITNFHGIVPLLMNEASGGEGDGGGSNSTAVATTETALTTTEDSGGDETALETTSGDGNQNQIDGARPAQNPAREVLRSHADPNVKKFWETATRAIGFRKEIGNMFPGGNPKTAIETLQRDMVALAGRNWNTPDPRDPARRTGLQQVRDKLAEIEDVDIMFYGANPQLLDGMTADEEGKAAFAKLAPHMEGKWKEIAPNAWAAKTARQILADMKGAQLANERGEYIADADIPYRIQRLSMTLGKAGTAPTELDLNLARNEIAAIAMYLQRLTNLSVLAPEVFTATTEVADTKLAERERRVSDIEMRQFKESLEKDRRDLSSQVLGKVLASISKGYQLTADDLEYLDARKDIKYNRLVKAFEPNADEARRGYIESGDRDGYLANEQRLINTHAVQALKSEFNKMIPRLAVIKPGQKATATTATATGTTAAARPAAGYVKITEAPPSHVIDNNGRTREMVFAKQAVLRIPWNGRAAGSRVQW